jgi:hypothetical protein
MPAEHGILNLLLLGFFVLLEIFLHVKSKKRENHREGERV